MVSERDMVEEVAAAAAENFGRKKGKKVQQ